MAKTKANLGFLFRKDSSAYIFNCASESEIYSLEGKKVNKLTCLSLKQIIIVHQFHTIF